MKSKILYGLSIMTVLACSTGTHALTTYMGLDIAHNDGTLKKDSFKKTNLDLEQSGLSYGITLGAAVTNHIAVEVFYSKYENGTGTFDVLGEELEVKQQGYGASVNFRHDIVGDIYGVATLGMKRLDIEKRMYKDDFVMIKHEDNTSFKPFFGAGIGVKTTDRINLEAKYSRFEDMNTISGTLIYRF